MKKSKDDLYSPERRTALVLSGIGTAGAYHAGVLRALHEAGVKLDIVAGRGVGAVGAVFAAVDGAQRLWDEKGFWRAPAVARLYSWRPLVRLTALAVALSIVLVVLPLAVVAVGLIVFPIDFLLKMVGVAAGGGLVSRYLDLAQRLFAPAALPTWLPRLVLLVLGLAATIAAVSAVAGPSRAEARRTRGRFWWRLLRAPIATNGAVEHCFVVLWDLVRGAAAQLKQPNALELGRRYTELLSENLGQPGFRELVIVAHDVDAHGDLVFALVAESRRRDLLRRPTTTEAEVRRAGIVDLSGVGREHLTDAVAAALTVPLAAEFHSITFAAGSYWRGETHRLCDRPASLLRLIEELMHLGVDQVILVSAAPDQPGPHQLDRAKLEGRGRIGEYLQSAEAAAVRDVTGLGGEGRPRIFTIQPAHNPIGPFDFAGGFDDRSDRRQSLGELMTRGYEDAYHQFIEPMVGASGERVGTV
jgi:patatin-like phospholipase